jgi:hypothetical protein
MHVATWPQRSPICLAATEPDLPGCDGARFDFLKEPPTVKRSQLGENEAALSVCTSLPQNNIRLHCCSVLHFTESEQFRHSLYTGSHTPLSIVDLCLGSSIALTPHARRSVAHPVA